ncbi:unnamed protein product [Ophioblennius macclurei]
MQLPKLRPTRWRQDKDPAPSEDGGLLLSPLSSGPTISTRCNTWIQSCNQTGPHTPSQLSAEEMRLSASLLIVAVSVALAGGVSVRSLVFPSETSTTYVEVTPLKPLSLNAFTLCMRAATELQGQREVILFAYRTQNHDELNVWRELDGRLSFYLAGDGVIFRGPELGPMETHFCFTWDSQSGAAAVFVDGRKSLTKIYRKGHTIWSGGTIILGQDPDSYLGSFDPRQSFVGELSDVNMWDSVLSQSEIQDLVSGKHTRWPNVINWETAKLQSHGNVVVLNLEV